MPVESRDMSVLTYDIKLPLHHLRFWFVLRQAHGMMQDRLERRLKKVGSTPEIAMALWILTSWKGETPCTPAELHARIGALLRRWDAMHPPEAPADFSGDLSRHPAEEIIQTLRSNAKTGRLRVASPFGPGEVYFEEGNVTHGTFAGIDGEEGIYLLFALQDGTFDFLSGGRFARKLMARYSEALVLEGLRRMDETREILAMRRSRLGAAGR